VRFFLPRASPDETLRGSLLDLQESGVLEGRCDRRIGWLLLPHAGFLFIPDLANFGRVTPPLMVES